MVKVLEPFQCVTKEISANNASISQVIPSIETLKIEVSSLTDSGLGIKTTKKEMLKTLKSQFDYIHIVITKQLCDCVIFRSLF